MMNNVPVSAPTLPLLVAALGCGSSSMRTLQSISLDPPVADAQNFASGQVSFVATGHFNKPPVSETPFRVGWSVSDTSIATISTDGVAQCVAGSSGTVNVKGLIAEVGINGDPGFRVEGTAHLTCP